MVRCFFSESSDEIILQSPREKEEFLSASFVFVFVVNEKFSSSTCTAKRVLLAGVMGSGGYWKRSTLKIYEEMKKKLPLSSLHEAD